MGCSRDADEWGGVGAAAAREVRVTLLTPPGRGALAVVGVAGPAAVDALSRLFSPRGKTLLADRPSGSIAFGTWRSVPDAPGEDVVVVRSGGERLEVHCHGGVAAAEAVLSSLERLGGRRQPWTDWLVDGGAGRIEVEAREALARAGGPKAARILARQLAGLLEAEVARAGGLARAGHVAEARVAIDRLVRAARVGLRLSRPWRVVVAGPTNAGKSSLVNAVAGRARAIVSPRAGTTRDLLETRLVLHGWEIDLVDTAGLRSDADEAAADAVERAGIARAIAACNEADLVVRVCDGTSPWQVAAPTGAGELVVAAKADLAGADADRGGHVLWTSAVTGAGIDELAARIVRSLVPEEIDEPALLAGAVPFTPRQLDLIEALRPGS